MLKSAFLRCQCVSDYLVQMPFCLVAHILSIGTLLFGNADVESEDTFLQFFLCVCLLVTIFFQLWNLGVHLMLSYFSSALFDPKFKIFFPYALSFKILAQSQCLNS